MFHTLGLVNILYIYIYIYWIQVSKHGSPLTKLQQLIIYRNVTLHYFFFRNIKVRGYN